MHSVPARTALTLAALGVLGLGALAPIAQAQPPSTPAIPLNNEQETTGAMGGASGFFAYTVDGDQFCYTITVEGLTQPAFAAHVHVGDRNVAGPIVIPLPIPTDATSFTRTQCVTDSDAAAVAANPRAYYVNVHTPTYTGGEVRGQLK